MPVLTGQDTQAIGSALANLFGNPADDAKAAAILASTAKDRQQLQGRQSLADLLGRSVTMGANGMPSFAPGSAGGLASGAALADGVSGLASIIGAMNSIPHTAAQIAASNAAASNAQANTALHKQEFEYKQAENARKLQATQAFGDSLRNGGMVYDPATQTYRINPEGAAGLFANATESGNGSQFGSLLHSVNSAGVSAAEAVKATAAAEKERRVAENANAVGNLLRTGAMTRDPQTGVLAPAAGREGDVLAAIVAGGLGTDFKAAMGALNESALESQKIANTPKTKAQVEGSLLQGAVDSGKLTGMQALMGLDPVKREPGQVVDYAPGDIRIPQAPSPVAGVFQAPPVLQTPQTQPKPTIAPAAPFQQGAAAQGNGTVVNGNSVSTPKAQGAPEKVVDQIQRALNTLNQTSLALRALDARPGAVGGVFKYAAPGLATGMADRAEGEVIAALQNAAAAKTHELYGGAYTENEAKRSSGFLPDIGYGAEKNTDRLRFMYNESAQKLEQALSMLPAGYAIPPELKAQIDQMRSFPESKLLGAFSGMGAGQQMPVLPVPSTKGQALGASDAKAFLDAAGGDKEKARELAQKQGFKLR